MKKRSAKLLVTVMLAGLLLCLTGCKETPQSLLKSMAANSSKAKSTSMNMTMDGELGMSAMGMDLDMTMKMDMDVDMTMDPMTAYAKGTVDISALGESETVNMEMYESQEGDKMLAYSSQDGTTWNKTEVDLPEVSADKLGLQQMAALGNAFELEDKTEDVNGEKCYVLKGKVDGETLQGMMNAAMGSMGSAGDLMKGIDWNEQEIPLVIKVSEKTKYPVQMSIDMAKLMEAAMGEAAAGTTCDKFDFVITFKSFDKTDAIEIPSEVVESAANSDISDEASEAQDELSDIFGSNSQTNAEDSQTEDLED